ncbi:hypothetical protein Trydic_g4677 [Trypoxylus dichotomus]
MTGFREKEVEDINDKSTQQEEKLNGYLRQLLSEKAVIDEKQCPFAYRFIDEEISRIQQKLVKGPPRDTRYIDVYHEKPVKISVKVLVPVKEHPRFNFIGKLLGQKGNNLKQLQEETMCYMNICGRGSMRDREKEEELRQSLEPKYAHLTEDLHVEIHTIAPPAEAHTRIAQALIHVRKYLVPEYNVEQTERFFQSKKSILGKVKLEEDEDWVESPKRSMYKEETDVIRKGPINRVRPRSPITSKSSVMSILNKARIAMEESHNIEHRRPAHSHDYEEYEENYRPPSKKFMDRSSPYGKNAPDVCYTKRKY